MEPFERVPRVNLLRTPRRAVPVAAYARAALVAVLLVLLVGSYQAYARLGDATLARDEATAGTRRERSLLGTAQDEVEALQAQMVTLKNAEANQSDPVKAVEQAQVDWRRAMATLYSVRVSGVEVGAVGLSLRGEMEVTGGATTVAQMQEYQAGLRRVSGTLELLTIDWNVTQAKGDSEDGLVSFRASLRLRQP